MNPKERDEIIDKLAQIEFKMDVIKKRLPEEVESMDNLLNSVDQLNTLSKEREKLKNVLGSVVKVVDKDKLESELLRIVQDAYDSSSKDESFCVGLSGGSLPSLLVGVLKQMKNVDWKKWLFFFCDERCVPSSSEESTFGAYKRLLNSVDPNLPISLEQFVTIDPALKSSKIAEDYLSKMRQRFDKSSNLPKFHILFLGLGPDGHTCSLFPDHKLLKLNNKWIGYIADSPKPPPERITMTLPVLNNARLCVFVATGESKAQVIKEIIEDRKPGYPAGMVQPHSGKLIWLLDRDAGSKLNSQANSV